MEQEEVMGVGAMDEGGFDLTTEEKGLDYHLPSTVQSIDQVENLSLGLAESLALHCPIWKPVAMLAIYI